MRHLVLVALVGAVAVLPACNRFGARKAVADAGLPYRATLAKGEDPRDMTISVKVEGVGLAEVRESVRYQATRHCLTERGQSDTDWVIDPATGDWAYTADSAGILTFRARCRV